jgi:prepilin-type N-terminal cleavage/methylation domain-containing protein
VGQSRRSRRGFTLTEILMAAGILGIGLTMVMSVFPVAVDQTRRSHEITMSALCARNVAATIRAKREIILPLLRNSITKDLTADISTNGWYVPFESRVYNPDSFLYDQNTRTYTAPTTAEYTKEGNYYPVVLATPVSVATTPSPSLGPWRVTIIVYKLHGQLPDNINTAKTGNTGTYMRSWADPNDTVHAMAGSYIIDWRPGDLTNTRGEAYMIDNTVTPTTGATIDWSKGSIWLAATPTVTGTPPKVSTGAGIDIPFTTTTTSATTCGLPGWVQMPQAVAAFHTIIGD